MITSGVHHCHPRDVIAQKSHVSVGGGFVVTPKSLQQGENIFYKQTNRDQADPARRRQDHSISDDHQLVLTAKDVSNIVDPLQEPDIEPVKWALPPMPFASGNDLLELCQKNNLTVAQVVWENERHYLSDDEIRSKTMNLWNTMDTCIREGDCQRLQRLYYDRRLLTNALCRRISYRFSSSR